MPITIRRFKVGSAQISDDSIGSWHIADNAVVSAAIKNGAVGSAKLGATSVYGDKIADAGIGTVKLAADSVYGDKIADAGVGSAKLASDSVYGDKIADDGIGSSVLIADNVIGIEHMRDGAVGYTELSTGLQGSFAGVADRPYMGDASEVTVTGTTPGTVKTATVLKDSYALNLGSIKIASELKASEGTYDMEILLGTVHKLSFTGTETVYKIHTGSIGLGAEADGALALEFTLKNSEGAGISYNRLVDIIAVM